MYEMHRMWYALAMQALIGRYRIEYVATVVLKTMQKTKRQHTQHNTLCKDASNKAHICQASDQHHTPKTTKKTNKTKKNDKRKNQNKNQSHTKQPITLQITHIKQKIQTTHAN